MVTISYEYRHLPTEADLPDPTMDHEIQNEDMPTIVRLPEINFPDHTQLPDSDGTFVKNFQEHPQSIIITSAIEPILQKIHPDGRYCIGQDSGIYWRMAETVKSSAEAPDWFYVPNVSPLLDGGYRRSYVLWQEFVAPLIAIEFVSGNGKEERDRTPPSENDVKAGKFWVYEQAIRIPFYAIYEVKKAAVEVYRLVDGRYEQVQPNERGHYAIPPLGVELGILHGTEEPPVPWLRWWDDSGNLLLTGDERAIAEREARLMAEAIAEQERLISQEERLAKQQAEREKQQVEALLQKYRDRFGDIPE